MRAGTSSAGYKPLPQEPASSSSPAHQSSSHTREDAFQVGELDEQDDDEGNGDIALRNLDLQNRHQRPRSGGGFSSQTPTIYEDSEDRDTKGGYFDSVKGSEGNMSYNGQTYQVESSSQSDLGDAYAGGGMRGVASDYAYGSGGSVSAPAKEGRKGDRTAMYVALVSSGVLCCS